MNADLGLHRLREATVWRYSYLVSQGGLSLLLYVALGRVLSTGAFTAAATALGIVTITQAIGDFGLSGATVAVLPNRGSLGRQVELRDLQAGAALAFLLGAPVAIGLCLLSSQVVSSAATLAVVAVAPTAGIAVAVAGTDGILRSSGEFKRPVVVVTLSRLGACAGVPVALLTGSAPAACLGISIGTVACSLPALRVLTVTLRQGNGRATVKTFGSAALPLGVSQAAIVASARLNTVILGGIASLRSAAVFESAWRLFQVGQYAFGGAPTAAAPFIANALSERSVAALRKGLLRAGLLIVAGGGLFAAVVIAGRGPICNILFGGSLGPDVGRSLLWLAPALPLNLLVLLMSVTLAAVSGRERKWIAGSYVLGATFNLALLWVLVRGHADVAGAGAAATGILASMLVLAARLRAVLRELDGPEPLTANRYETGELAPLTVRLYVGFEPEFALASEIRSRFGLQEPTS